MALVQSDVDGVLTEARRFFKLGPKTANKIYVGSNPASAKQTVRNENAKHVMSAMGAWRRSWMFAQDAGQTPIEIGADWVADGATLGNCWEMSLVTTHFCNRRLGTRAREIGICMTNQPGDHGFVMVRDGMTRQSITDFLEQYSTIDRFARYQLSGYWIIDCWSGVACRSFDYKTQIRQKFTAWHEQGKHIVSGATPTPSGDITMRAQSPIGRYWLNLIHSSLSLVNARASF